MKNRILIAAAVVVALLGIWSAPAMAAPTGAKSATTINMICDNGVGTTTVVLMERGAWSPGHATTSTGERFVGVPYEFHIVGTFTPVGGVPEPFIQDSVKKAPNSGRLSTCTWSESGSDATGAFTINGMAKVSYTPLH